jgi:hypothetical protein
MAPRRSVIAHHLVWTVYGTWLPNDPRGSGSRYVAASALAELGGLAETAFGRARKKRPGGGFWLDPAPGLLHSIQ